MSIKDDGEPAFPSDAMWGYQGMSLRDYFAAAALRDIRGIQVPVISPENTVYELAAERAYAYADAMLKERAK